MLLARPRSEECSARQGPRTRARQRARGRQQDRARQAQGDGRVRQIRLQHRRGPGGPAAAWCPRDAERRRSGGSGRGSERAQDSDDRPAHAAAASGRPGCGCAQRTGVPGDHPVRSGPRPGRHRFHGPAQAAGPARPHARSGRQAGQRARHRGGGRRGACLGAEGRAGGRGQGRAGGPHAGRRTPGAAAPGRRWLASAARARCGSAATRFAGRRPPGYARNPDHRPSRPGRRHPSGHPRSR